MGAQVGTGPQINTQSCSILEEKGLLYTLVLMHTKTNTYIYMKVFLMNSLMHNAILQWHNA